MVRLAPATNFDHFWHTDREALVTTSYPRDTVGTVLPMDTDVSFSPLGPGLAPSILIWDFAGYFFYYYACVISHSYFMLFN